MQPTRLTVVGVVGDPEVTEGETTAIVNETEQVTLSIAGDPAAVSQGWGWQPYECVFDGTGMPVGSDPCPECGRNNVRPTPLMWASSATIKVDPEADMVQVQINLLAGGVLLMEVHPAQDGKRLIVHTPRAGDIPLGTATITQIADGAYEIKD